MIKIDHKRDEGVLENLPAEVVVKVVEILTVLDESYGHTREIDHDLGGYVLIAEVAEDIEFIKKIIDFGYTLPEYVDLITCENDENYTTALMLLSNDYSISLVIPLSFTPKELLIHLEQ